MTEEKFEIAGDEFLLTIGKIGFDKYPGVVIKGININPLEKGGDILYELWNLLDDKLQQSGCFPKLVKPGHRIELSSRSEGDADKNYNPAKEALLELAANKEFAEGLQAKKYIQPYLAVIGEDKTPLRLYMDFDLPKNSIVLRISSDGFILGKELVSHKGLEHDQWDKERLGLGDEVIKKLCTLLPKEFEFKDPIRSGSYSSDKLIRVKGGYAQLSLREQFNMVIKAINNLEKEGIGPKPDTPKNQDLGTIYNILKKSDFLKKEGLMGDSIQDLAARLSGRLNTPENGKINYSREEKLRLELFECLYVTGSENKNTAEIVKLASDLDKKLSTERGKF